MEGWGEVTKIPFTGIGSTSPRTAVSTKFDSQQNIILVGDDDGYVSSFIQTSSPFSNETSPYTKYLTNSSHHPVTQLLSHRDGTLALSTDEVSFFNRRGVPKGGFDALSFKDDSFKSLNAMSFNCNSFNDVVVSTNSSLLKFDLNKPNVLTKFNHEGKITLIKESPKLLALAGTTGSLELFDPTSNASLKTFSAHNGYMSDLDVKGNYIASCGYSVKPKRYNYHQTPEYLCDPLVNIFDIRMMKAIAPVAFPAGVSSVRFHPKLPNILIIASAFGLIQFVDIFDQTNVKVYHADMPLPPQQTAKQPSLSDLQISENGDFFSFNDGYSNIHLWSITNADAISKNFVNFPQNIEKPDITIDSETFIDIDDNNVPLSIVGMPYYKELLLSNWPVDLKFIKERARLPNAIDSDLLAKADQGLFKYDSLKYGAANVVTNFYSLTSTKDSQIPKFLSEKSDQEKEQKKSIEALEESVLQCRNEDAIPNCYSRLQIQYSKFGIKDFDFAFYNRTEKYCGLENHSDNSYINALLQLFRFQPSFYNQVVNSLSTEWLPNEPQVIETNSEGSSILNELAYLFDMMYKAKASNVKTTNFSQVMNHDANASKLINLNELMNLSSHEVRELIVSFNNYLLNRLNLDFKSQFDIKFDLTELTYEIQILGRGHSCPVNEKQLGTTLSLDLITPPNNMLNKMSILINPNNQDQPTNFSNIRTNLNILTYLDYSMNQCKTVPCTQHLHTHPHTLEIRTSIIKLPPVLVLNVNLTNEEFKLINCLKKWLVPEMYALKARNNQGYSFKPTKPLSGEYKKYELLGYVCEISHQIDSSRTGGHNLVSFIKIQGEWILFNDYLVIPIPEEEVFNLTHEWKKPVIVVYQEADKVETFDYITHFQGNDSILYRDHFAGAARKEYQKQYILLTKQEAPHPGTLVAIDAEFVTLRPEQLEISYLGSKKLIKPKDLSLARVSVLRGDDESPLFGKAFIDDYIVHTSPIYDYLTSFSGIEPMDLDFCKSNKNLVTLQTAYRKLWLLLNLKVIFVGHGLYTDFRTINLQVPKEQIRDTADFYYMASFKRQLSLKFLAFVMLRERVQRGNHDSIEDARTALLLYKKYVELKKKGEFESKLNYIYEEGHRLKYRVPES
ncbi:PAN2 [Candida oxycetoniae]|uniref:PAN2-PAN3 deadenylation complex catalytic subunit PAN2 n=1 Tax=Candida oxycetoniae TaxID=497107 RepID=A0AAI9STE1_9ASCO|nr:PAN2 [Candida oxycetoniae]KAI3402461.2 PAN2 [Candida oxycetoniae]